MVSKWLRELEMSALLFECIVSLHVFELVHWHQIFTNCAISEFHLRYYPK